MIQLFFQSELYSQENPRSPFFIGTINPNSEGLKSTKDRSTTSSAEVSRWCGHCMMVVVGGSGSGLFVGRLWIMNSCELCVISHVMAVSKERGNNLGCEQGNEK